MSILSRKLLPSTSALAAFDSVARLGSFSAAADELSLTQGAISRQIQTLEQQLGVQLFERTSRGVGLTQAGGTYARAIAAALAEIRSASLNVMTGIHSNMLNLAILPTFGTRWLLPRVPGFVASHPQITFNFATRIGVFDFDRDGLDAAIHVGQPDWPGADCTYLMSETVAPVASPAFLAENPIHSPEDVARLPLLHMASRPGAWRHWFDHAGLSTPPAQGMRFEQFSNVAQACIAGLGVALMPLFLIDSELRARHLVIACDLPVKSASAYYLAVPHKKAGYDPVIRFRDWLLDEVARYRAQEEVPAW
ncbi:LysR family transcriptional regulator [Allorhizobium borbori]|uniref:HTH-type transcriptional regulator TtuA n=1 Tax=Allorhizobium borbori TaxID=485907 RepID=A0A7W6K140_9HYPH|nr:LysR family transcriptional regulator [Allorhizobium borbori]MBB4102185.1 DNA-binding transcriptional LysR family regulator [Allorhizobium borbori]PZU23186.1 MAG: LysR family transcriptional regulator [Shinella sp.]